MRQYRLILDSLVSAHLMSQTWTNESTAHEARRLGSVNDQLKSLGVKYLTIQIRWSEGQLGAVRGGR